MLAVVFVLPAVRWHPWRLTWLVLPTLYPTRLYRRVFELPCLLWPCCPCDRLHVPWTKVLSDSEPPGT